MHFLKSRSGCLHEQCEVVTCCAAADVVPLPPLSVAWAVWGCFVLPHQRCSRTRRVLRSTRAAAAFGERVPAVGADCE